MNPPAFFRNRTLVRCFAVAFLMGVAGCKTNGPEQARLRDAVLPTASGRPTVTSDPAGTPLLAVQLGSGRLLGKSCHASPPTEWSSDVVLKIPALVPPGTFRVERDTFADGVNDGWTREPHAVEEGIDVWTANASTYEELLSRFGPRDPSAIGWHQLDTFGASLGKTLEAMPAGKGGLRFGVVVLRKILASASVGMPQTAPNGVASTAASYAECGDGFLTGRVVADHFLVVLSAPTDAKRAAAVQALTSIAANRDIQDNINTLDKALAADAWLIRAKLSGDQLLFQSRGGTEVEAEMNAWRRAAEPTGVASVLGVARLYDAYEAASGDPIAAKLKPALGRVTQGRQAAASQSGEARTTLDTSINALVARIEACGGRRFETSCDDLGTLPTFGDGTALAKCVAEGVDKPFLIGTKCQKGNRFREYMNLASDPYYHDVIMYENPFASEDSGSVNSFRRDFEGRTAVHIYALGGRNLPSGTPAEIDGLIRIQARRQTVGSRAYSGLCPVIAGHTCRAIGEVDDFFSPPLYLFAVKPTHVAADQLVEIFSWDTANRTDPGRPAASGVTGGMIAYVGCGCDKAKDKDCAWFLDRGYECRRSVGWAYKAP